MFRAVKHAVVRAKTSRAEPAALSAFVSQFSAASNSQRLAGKVAVITGGASGLGKATAAEFVRNGAKVVLADVQDDLGHAVAAELGTDAACYTRCDVTDEAQVAAAVDLAVARHGRLDVMFNNDGISGALSPVPLGSLDLADFDRVMAVNARAVLAGVKHAARVMVPNRSGSIICTASTAAVLGVPGVQRVEGGGGGPRARRGRGNGARRGARERHLAQLHPDADGDGVHGRVLPRDEHRGAQADRGEGHARSSPLQLDLHNLLRFIVLPLFFSLLIKLSEVKLHEISRTL